MYGHKTIQKKITGPILIFTIIAIMAIIIIIIMSDSGQCAVMVSSSPGSLQGPIGEITTTKLDVREMFSPVLVLTLSCEIFLGVVLCPE